MSTKHQSIRYLRIMVDMIAEYFISVGIVSFTTICNIISAGMPEEGLSFEGLFRVINSFHVCVVLIFGVLIFCEIFIFGNHRYMRADCVCIALESSTIAQINEQAIIKMKKEQRLSLEDIEKMKAVEYFQSLKDASFSVTVLQMEDCRDCDKVFRQEIN